MNTGTWVTKGHDLLAHDMATAQNVFTEAMDQIWSNNSNSTPYQRTAYLHISIPVHWHGIRIKAVEQIRSRDSNFTPYQHAHVLKQIKCAHWHGMKL